ncbi:hypothetical protein [Edaphobacter flagellatus]|uniref:hypothetical protein n=1 Tax=Edaphobacter flagellatus TaxID=1933044 RepID=UPI0021B2ED70|nr:hypothetical protein [Edaphobacter flagellatus]
MIRAVLPIDLPESLARLVDATDDVVTAAESVANSYSAGGGYTANLSLNLRRLEAVVRVWRAALEAMSLDSDTNGFDRSTRYSNGQTFDAASSDSEGGETSGERWAEGTATTERKPPHRASTRASAQPRGSGAT